jgi:multidrug efflux pump subunit AcrA (membrane-fusion protein)
VSTIRKLLILPPLIAGAAILAWSLSNPDAPERAERGETATRVAVIEAVPQGVVPRVVGFGTVSPARTWRLVPQVSGRIVEIHPELTRGGTVSQGDLLLRIAPETYEAALAEAEANIAATRAEIEELELTRDTTRASLGIEREALRLAERELERQRDLLARDTVSQSAVDQQERAVLQQRARVQELENRLKLLPARIDALRQSLEVSEAHRRVAELDLERTEIRAPFDARVASADVEIEQFVGTGAAIAVLDGIAAAEIDAQIPPARMSGFIRLAAGERFGSAPAEFRTVARRIALSARVRLAEGAGVGAWEAEVVRISDTVDPETRSVGVIVSVPDPYEGVVPGRKPPLIKGMFTRVELRAPMVKERILVPRSSVRDGRVMLADDDDRLRFVPVEVVYTLGETAVLADGLERGARVIVSDPSPALPGMLLETEPAEDVAARIAGAARPEEAARAPVAAPGGASP